MSDPKVTAIIEAKDNASAVIKRVSELAMTQSTAVGHHANSVLGQVGSAHSAMTASVGSGMDAVAASGSRLSAVAEKAGTAFGLMSANALVHMTKIGYEMSNLERKLKSFGDLTNEQADGVRKLADTKFSSNLGGPTGQMEGAKQLVLNGVGVDKVAGMLDPLSMFSTETGQNMQEGANDLLGHMQMLQRVRDDSGKVISLADATAEQVKRAAEKTVGFIAEVFRNVPGNFADILSFSKVAAPSAIQLKVPDSVLFAEEGVLAQAGVRGEPAGTNVAGINRRLLSPTSKGRAAYVEAGLHYSDYVKLDPNLVTPEGAIGAFEQRAGSANAGERAKITTAVQHFHDTKDLDAFNVALSDAFVSSGNKGLKNRVAASNAANDISKGAIVGSDVPKLLQDIHDKNVSVGLVQTMFRENANAVLILSQGIGELKRLTDHFEHTDGSQNFQNYQREKTESFSGSIDNLTGAIHGLEDRLFTTALERPMTSVDNLAAGAVRTIASLPDGIARWIGEIVTAAGVLTTYKVGEKLAEWTGLISKTGSGIEAAIGPLGEMLAMFTRFSTLGAAITAAEVGNAIGEGVHAIGEVAAGKFYTPNDPVSYTGLEHERDDLQEQLDRHQARTFGSEAGDAKLIELQRERYALDHIDGGNGTDLAKARQRLLDERAALPSDDAALQALQRRLVTLEAKQNGPTPLDVSACHHRGLCSQTAAFPARIS